jgi:hypothetical protein
MGQLKPLLRRTGFTVVSLAALVTTPTAAQQTAPSPAFHPKGPVAGPRPIPSVLDFSKSVVIERPTQALVKDPGRVRWHATFADACGKARRSGKPVLLFQMMGKLDDQFC